MRGKPPQERTIDLVDCYSGSREPSMRSGRAMCLSIEEGRTSVPQTWTGSTQNCTRHWPPIQLTRRWHPSSRLKKLKSKETLDGQRSEREARRYHRHRVALLTESAARWTLDLLLNSELYAVLALKTTDAALGSIVSLEEAEA